MPYKDPEDKKAWSRRWKKHGRENGYNKWLSDRRRLRLQDAKEFRKALEIICEIGETRDVEVAEEALKASDKRLGKLGPSPKTPREKSPEVVADSLMEAVARLGL